MNLNDKTILLTGGTGSFGQKFTEIVLKKHRPKSIRIFSRGEFLQWQMAKKFNDPRLRFLIGDVREKDRVYRAMNGVDVVVHAAALKQIPAIEYNPLEAIQTNIMGTANMVDAAIDNNVAKAMLISSDKAVSPVNLYGATKLCAEKLFIQGNSYASRAKTKFACVRYGNVMGSRRSVIPLFLEQKKKGVLTITDKRMTRFWITLDQGVNLVIDSIGKMEGGEIYIPKIPSMKIIDLAQAVMPNTRVKITGIRPGEKIHETLLSSEEARRSKEFNKHFVVEPEFPLWKKENRRKRTNLSDGFKYSTNLSSDFRYSSDTNKEWFSKEQIRKILKDLD